MTGRTSAGVPRLRRVTAIPYVTVATTPAPPFFLDERAVCSRIGTNADELNLFFPEQGTPDPAARKLCNGTAKRPPCPLRRACYEYALPITDLHGVWGGTSQHQREAIRRGLRPMPEWYTEAQA